MEEKVSPTKEVFNNTIEREKSQDNVIRITGNNYSVYISSPKENLEKVCEIAEKILDKREAKEGRSYHG